MYIASHEKTYVIDTGMHDLELILSAKGQGNIAAHKETAFVNNLVEKNMAKLEYSYELKEVFNKHDTNNETRELIVGGTGEVELIKMALGCYGKKYELPPDVIDAAVDHFIGTC